MKLFTEFNIEYARYLKKGFPTRAIAGIELVPGALVEISAVACKE